MMKGILPRFLRRKPKPDLAVIIARAAVRRGNRCPDAARAYEQKHAILMRGPKC